MPTYAAYGLLLRSAIALDSAGPPVSADLRVDLSIRLGDVAVDDADLADDPGTIRSVRIVRHGWRSNQVVLVIPGIKAALDIDTPMITIAVEPGARESVVEHAILDHVVPRWIALRGDRVMHGAAVVDPGGEATILVGPTGHGKSSAAAGFGNLGWPVLTDDAARIHTTDNKALVFPSYRGVRLTETSRTQLAPHAPAVPLADNAAKSRVMPTFDFAQAPAKLRAIAELGIDHPEIRVTRLSVAEATMMVMRHSFALSPTRETYATTAFAAASAVATTVKCFRIDFPRRWDVYPELARTVQELV